MSANQSADTKLCCWRQQQHQHIVIIVSFCLHCYFTT